MSQAVQVAMTSIRGHVSAVEKEARDTFTLTVAPASGQALRPFQPGQFNKLYAFGVGELPISISGDPDEPDRLVYTVRSAGEATQALVSRKPGDALGIRGPFGTPWPLKAARAKDVLIVAGGIGLAPLRPALYHVLRHRDQYSRLMVLYGARSPLDLLYRKQLAQWARQPNTQVLTTVDCGGLSWRGHVGAVTSLFRHLRLDPAQTTAFISGPDLMMRYVVRLLEARGLPPGGIYVSMERNMECANGCFGRCRLGPYFICRDGPIFSCEQIRRWMDTRA